jgi:hypothetical protein
MTDDDEPISVWDVIENVDRRTTLEDRLRTGRLVSEIESIDGPPLHLDGSQGCFVYRINTGETVVVKRSDQTVHGVPLGAEGPAWVRNEAAAYELARILGFEDLVLPTMLRNAEDADGHPIQIAIRLYVESTPAGELVEGAPLTTVDGDQLARAAIFDWLVEQTDRRAIGDHGGNWYILREPDRPPRLLLFDHQQCFGSRVGFGLASGIWDSAGHKIGPYLDAVRRLIDNEDTTSRLSQYLTPTQIADLLGRAKQIAG